MGIAIKEASRGKVENCNMRINVRKVRKDCLDESGQGKTRAVFQREAGTEIDKGISELRFQRDKLREPMDRSPNTEAERIVK